ncbi:(2Fe-2S)-binding protein, partial [Streptomyces sp. NPDC057654]|uniref:(2Fe-2S)-binding protein n=1 Tax=Streptomyces sp. NPDC057654 TaxID=3346196 RepID=UPI0036C686B5
GPTVHPAPTTTGAAAPPAAEATEPAAPHGAPSMAPRATPPPAAEPPPPAPVPTPPSADLAALMARVRSARRFAAALADAHPVRGGWQSWLGDDTVVCRCEEVTYGQVKEAVAGRGADGMRVLKLVCRAGLGSCQGRVCGRNVAEIAGGLLGASDLADPHAADRRPIAQPIRLGDLGDLGDLGEPGESTVS